MNHETDIQLFPPVVVPDGIDWEATTAEYASLLGMSQRTTEQDDRYFHLSRLMDRRPPPWMTPTEQAAYLRCMERTEQSLIDITQRHAHSKRTGEQGIVAYDQKES